MKIKLKCDKKYGNQNINSIDATFFDTLILSNIVRVFQHNDIVEVTEEFVDSYNNQVKNNYRRSFKTAENIVKQLRKIYKKNI